MFEFTSISNRFRSTLIFYPIVFRYFELKLRIHDCKWMNEDVDKIELIDICCWILLDDGSHSSESIFKFLWFLKIVEYKFISTARLEFPFLSPILKLCNKIHLVENLLKIKFQLYEMGTRNENRHVKYLLVNRKIKVISTWFDAKRTTSSLVNLWHRLRILMSWKWCFAW